MERELYYSKDGTKVMIVAPVAEFESILEHMDRLKYKYDYMLIIGNGFDLSLGLPTTYRNFVESCIFKKMYVKRMQEKQKNKITKPTLLDYLYGKKFFERWYDIEAALLEYVSKKPDGSFVNNVEEDKKDYELVSYALVNYLSDVIRKLKFSDTQKFFNTPAERLLNALNSYRNIEYTFNYTPIERVLETYAVDSNKVHGEVAIESIEKGNANYSSIILGIECNDLNSIAPGYSFLIKSNHSSFASSNIASDLLNSKNLIIFGHSLNKMDFGYFYEYFKELTMNNAPQRSLTIITKDDTSRREILDNIRNRGISVREMFTHTDIKIILTDDIGKKGTKSAILFEELLEAAESIKYR